MSLRFLAAPALIAAAFAPAISQAQQSQITIQTQATVMVPPDRGTVPVIVSARGSTEREARALLERNDMETRKVVVAKGSSPARFQSSPALRRKSRRRWILRPAPQPLRRTSR